ncbi:MAG: T9SS type A sorting domain-containing protein [Ignavibacteriales bacterium]|nr:T9SS type A sorting domain-containing protein [Ignavibacteriales bacterium]
MKTMQKILVVSIVLLSTLSVYGQPIPADSMYLGQAQPQNTPKIFNLPVTSGHRACERIAISADGKEIFYGELNTYPVTSGRVRCLKYLENKWQGPFDVFEGFIAPKFSINDSILYLQNSKFYTYYSKRTSTGWSAPVRLFSKNIRTHYFQMTNLNNFYASSYYEGSTADGNLSKLIVVNQDTLLQSLGAPLNSSNQENDFFMAADESYVLFSKNALYEAGDIYLSFKKENGRWTNPKKLGDAINKPGNSWEYGQFVSHDGKYLFFTRGGNSMASYYTYWVKIDNIVDSLRVTNFVPYLNYQIPAQSIDTGRALSYIIPDSTFIDDDGNNTLTYSAALSDGNPLPAWLSFNPGTRAFQGTPSVSGKINVKVTALDSAHAAVACTFAINVIITGADESKVLLPKGFSLDQNYPNPFNPTTVIEFSIPKAGRYKLSIYNTLGKHVMDVSDKEYSTGNYKEIFNASGLSSGLYLYRLTGDNANLARKMLLLR